MITEASTFLMMSGKFMCNKLLIVISIFVIIACVLSGCINSVDKDNLNHSTYIEGVGEANPNTETIDNNKNGSSSVGVEKKQGKDETKGDSDTAHEQNNGSVIKDNSGNNLNNNNNSDNNQNNNPDNNSDNNFDNSSNSNTYVPPKQNFQNQDGIELPDDEW